MTVIASSVNVATPSYAALAEYAYEPTSLKYFSLIDNTLDGTYKLLDDGAVYWSAALSGTDGIFATPIELTVTGIDLMHSLRVFGDVENDCYPVHFGMTLYNGLVKNGNFANGVTNWTAGNGTAAVTNSVLRITNSSTTVYSQAEQIMGNVGYGRKFYIRMKVRVTNSLCTKLSLVFQERLGTTFIRNTTVRFQYTPVQDQWYTAGVIISTTANTDWDTLRLLIIQDYATIADATGKVLEIKEVIGIDMGTDTSNTLFNYTAVQMEEYMQEHVSIEVLNNTNVEYVYHAETMMDIDSYRLTVYSINKPNYQLRLTNLYNEYTLVRNESTSLRTVETSDAAITLFKNSTDTLALHQHDSTSRLLNEFFRSKTEKLGATIENNPEYRSIPRNIHTALGEPYRMTYGKLEITYTDPLLDSSIVFDANTSAYNSRIDQTSDGFTTVAHDLFTLYKNDLSGNYHPMDSSTQVGWWGKLLSDVNGSFATPEQLSVSFPARPIVGIYLQGRDNNYPVDFSIVFTNHDDTDYTYTVTGHTDPVYKLDVALTDIVAIHINISKISEPNAPACIVEVPILSTISYGASDIMSFDILSELTYEDDIHILGGISANEFNAVLNNESGTFNFNSQTSLVSQYLTKNRKIVAWLGIEVADNYVEWYKQGVFWTYKWDVPQDTLIAKVTAFDTLGLLGTTEFYEHTVYTNTSIGALADLILNDAKVMLDELTWEIDAALYDVVIPYAWFNLGSHFNALSRLAGCYPIDIYCTREGIIRLALKKVPVQDKFVAEWNDTDFIIAKNYPTLYSTVPNMVECTLKACTIAPSQLLDYTVAMNVSAGETHRFTFNGIYAGNIDITAVATAVYTYEVYSWGLILHITTSGTISSLQVTGDTLSTNDVNVRMRRNEDSIKYNGIIKAQAINSDLVQTISQADYITSALFGLQNSKYTAEITYRGDFSLELTDTIKITNGIAPTDRYLLRRNKIFWDGFLTGEALIST